MKLKRMIGLSLSFVMAVSSVNLAFAKNDNVWSEQENATESKYEYLNAGNDDISKMEQEKDIPVQPMASYDTIYQVEGGYIYFNSSTGTITDADTFITSAIIPEKINGTSVTSIGDSAFWNCSSLIDITIPNSVTDIEIYAFRNCSSLIDITIPNSVTDIESYAFRNCSSLTSITIPNSVTNIRNDTFYDCSSLTSITIPNSVTSIGDAAFSGCSSITGITIPSSVTSIGDYAFSHCSSLIDITIPNSVTNIGDYAFCGCSSLTSITIPNSVIGIGNHAFSGCSGLTSISIPNSVTSIGDSVFYRCSSLIDITIPNSVTDIGDYAFCDCSSLTSITIPNSVTNIGNDTFWDCSSLTSITIPSSVTSIGDFAFYLNSLEDVYYGGSENDWNKISIGSDNEDLLNATIHYNQSIKDDNQSIKDDNQSIKDDSLDTRTLTIDFSGGQDIIYDVDDGTYNKDSFNLIGTIDNLYLYIDDTINDYMAKNVNVKITLPDGYSFNTENGGATKTLTYDSILNSEYINETVYLNNPIVGTSKVNVNITGDNIEEKNFIYDFIVESEKFDVDIYRANYALNSDIGTLIEKDFSKATPNQQIYKVGIENNMSTMSDAYSLLMDNLALVDNPTNIIDYAFEEKDMYSAIIMDMFESSFSSSFLDTLKVDIFEEGNKLISTVAKEMQTLYNYNILDGNFKLSDMTEKQLNCLEKALEDCFKEEHPKATATIKVTGKIGDAIKYAKNVEDLVENVATYYHLSMINDSMLQVMKDMYNACPSDNLALKSALLDCIQIVEANDLEFALQMATYTGNKVCTEIAKFGVEKMWSGIKKSFCTAHPAAYAFQAAYTGGKYISNVMFNAEDIQEKWCNVVAMNDLEELMHTVYNSKRSNFINKNDKESAKTYNSSIDVMYNMLTADCNTANGYVESVGSGVVDKILAFFGDDSVETLSRQINVIKGSYEANHMTILVGWLNRLEVENYTKFKQYEHIFNEVYNIDEKEYTICCPVDVYIFDKDGVAVGYVVDNTPFVRSDADITIVVVDDKKTIYMNADNEYDIVYVGNGSGTMDITIKEYENSQVVRNVYFYDLVLTDGLKYTSTENGTILADDTYTIVNEAGSSISPDFDSKGDNAMAYTANIENGYFSDGVLFSKEMFTGEKAEIVAYVPDGYKFTGWSSNAGTDIFEDATSCITNIIMVENNVNITANYVRINNTFIYGDSSADGTLTANDAAIVLKKVLNNSYAMPIEEKVKDYFKYVDANNDGVLTAADSTVIIQKVLNSEFKMLCEK